MTIRNAVLIRKTPHREHDHVCEFLTPERGKITVVARGTRRINSKLNPHLAYLNAVAIRYVEGPKNKVLVGADTLSYFQSEDYRAYQAGFEVLRLIDERVWAELPEPFTFELVSETIARIGAHPSRARTLVAIFKVQFLKALGYFPDFVRCVMCQGAVAIRRVFSFTHGGLVCDLCSAPEALIAIHNDALFSTLAAIGESGFEREHYYSALQGAAVNSFMDKLIDYFAHTR